MVSARAFANKIWNAARFIFLKMEYSGVQPWLPKERDSYIPLPSETTLEPPLEDRWIFSRLNRCAEQVNRSLQLYRFHEAAQTLWHFLWHEFCDWYVEIKKLRFTDNSGLNADWRNMITVFEAGLRMLHPVMPFITEELWQRLAQGQENRRESISLTKFPLYDVRAADHAAEREMDLLQDMITSLRNLRSDLQLDPKQQFEAAVFSKPAAAAAVAHRAILEKLANVKLEVADAPLPHGQGVIRSSAEFEVLLRVPAAQVEARRKRIEKDNQQLEKNIANSRRQLGDEAFLARAPEKVVNNIREKLAEYEAQLGKNRADLEALG
jgi:valyl-tRNA synthetase